MAIETIGDILSEPYTGLRYHDELVQGSDEWLAARCGVLTASEMRHVITPTLKIAANDKARAHMWEMVAQRITRHVEPSYISDDMLRGLEDEADARAYYAANYAPVKQTGFITNNKWGFTIGYSPDGLVSNDGLIEIKSRRQKYQLQTICEHEVPVEYMMQLQVGLLVSERAWIDFVSYSAGLPMVTIRVFPDAAMHAAIVEAAADFEGKVAGLIAGYHARVASAARLVPTERKIEVEMF